MFIPVLIATIKVNKILKYLQPIDEIDKNSKISSVYIFYCREMDPDLWPLSLDWLEENGNQQQMKF